jgi:hypothetical protein
MTWQERAEQWRRFAAWEAKWLRESPPEPGQGLAWMAEAWELARRSCPGWAEGLDLEHVRHIGHVRAALGRAGPPA